MPGKWDELSYDKLHNLGVVIIIYRILWQSQHIIPNPIAGEYRWMIKPSNLHIISTSDTDANNVDTETKIGACLTPYHEDITTIACVLRKLMTHDDVVAPLYLDATSVEQLRLPVVDVVIIRAITKAALYRVRSANVWNQQTEAKNIMFGLNDSISDTYVGPS